MAILVLCAVSFLGLGSTTSIKLTHRPSIFIQHNNSLKAPPPTHGTKAGQTVHINGGLLTMGGYFVDVSLGSEQKSVSLLFDTGSSNVAVKQTVYNTSVSTTANRVRYVSEACSACNPDGSSECVYGDPYPSLYDEDYCGYGINYGGGRNIFSGQLVSDSVTFGGKTVSNQLIFVAHQLFPAGQPINGIFGLSHELAAVNPTWAPTWFSNLIKQDSSIDAMFGVCLDDSNGGSFDLGGINSAHYTDALQWVPVTKQLYWNVDILDFQVAGVSVGLPPFVYSYDTDSVGSFPDSGTSILIFAPIIFSAMTSLFQSKHCDLPSVCTDANIFDGQTCISEATYLKYSAAFPSLQVVMKGVDGAQVVTKIHAKRYFMMQSGEGGKKSYCLSIVQGAGVGLVLGAPYMTDYYVVHDFTQNRIGIAPSHNCLA